MLTTTNPTYKAKCEQGHRHITYTFITPLGFRLVWFILESADNSRTVRHNSTKKLKSDPAGHIWSLNPVSNEVTQLK